MKAYKKGQSIERVALVVGLSLFVLLVAKTDIAVIMPALWQVGAGFLLLLLISGARHALRALAWYYCIEPAQRRVTLVDLFNIRLVGEALTDLTFWGPVLGETVRAAAVSKRVSGPYSLSSVVVEDLVFGLSLVLFILSGLLVLVFNFAVPRQIRIASVVLCLALILLGLAAYPLIDKGWKLLDGLVGLLKRLSITRRVLEPSQERIRLFEENVLGFYSRHQRVFFAVLFIEILAGLTGVIEAYFILSMTTHRTSLLAAYIMEVVNRIVNVIFAFIPLRVGVEEGGAGLALTAVGYNLGAGVSLAIIRKIRNLFWVGMGLLIFARCSLAGTLKEDSGPFVRAASECQ